MSDIHNISWCSIIVNCIFAQFVYKILSNYYKTVTFAAAEKEEAHSASSSQGLFYALWSQPSTSTILWETISLMA